MSMIGTFGQIPFVVSLEQLNTFYDFERKTAARWTKHNNLRKQPKPEFIGPDLDTITFSMKFDIRYGMNPRKEMEKLLDIAREGKAESLIIAGKGLGTYKWTIKSLSQKWLHVDNHGNVLVGEANIELEEYPRHVKEEKKVKVLTVREESKDCFIEVKGKKLSEKGFVRNGQSYVPIRAVADALDQGKAVHWKNNNGKETVTINGILLTTFLKKDGIGYAWSREIGNFLKSNVSWKGATVFFT